MKRSNKHAITKKIFAPLGGGINVAVPPEQISEAEMQKCENFIYERDSARLVGRGGLQLLTTFQNRIRSMYYDIETNTIFAFLENRDCYQLTVGSGTVQKKYLDKVSGEKPAKCCKFSSKLFVATGENLQVYDFKDNFLKTITSAPKCDLLFYRFSRLAVTMTGSDRITYSSVGDADSEQAWVENMNDDSSSKWLDISGNDGGDIIDIVPLATDMIIFKDNGTAHQFVGDADFNSWAVYTVASQTDLIKGFEPGMCATNIGQGVVFLSLRGLKTLSATQDYGNITAADIGSKFNKLITNNMFEPRLYHLSRHMTIIIQPTSDAKYFVAYNYGMNAATVLKFGIDVNYILETKDDLFVASGNGIYRWTNEATLDGDVPIQYLLSPKDIIGSEKVLLKAIDTKFSSDRAGTAIFSVGERLKASMPTNSRKKIKITHSEETIHMEISSNSRFEVDHIMLDIADL